MFSHLFTKSFLDAMVNMYDLYFTALESVMNKGISEYTVDYVGCWFWFRVVFDYAGSRRRCVFKSIV